MATPIVLDRSRWATVEHTSNNPLPDAQKHEIEALLSEAQEEKQRLDAEVARIQLILRGLQSEVVAKITRIATLKAMISPLKYFPNELIAKIFEEYAAGLSRPPWHLGHICSRWREVALTTPNIWNTVVVRLDESYLSFDEEEVLFLRGAKGSTSCILSLGWSSPAIYSFLPIFNRYASSIHHLSMKAVDVFLPLLTLPGGSLSSLERLDLHFYPPDQKTLPAIVRAGETPPYRAITLFKHSPRLRSVSVETYRDGWKYHTLISPLQLPWAQLTQLLLSPFLFMDDLALSGLLRPCINLVKCRLPIPEDLISSTTQPTLIRLRNLETIEITNGFIANLWNAKKFIKQLLLPSLKRLTLTSPIGTKVEWPLDGISNLILRSACDIRVFHLRSSLPNDSTLALLHIMPSLTELSVQGIAILPFILGRMAHEDFLPNLISIECCTYWLSQGVIDEVLEALGDTGFMEPLPSGGIPRSVHIIMNTRMDIPLQLDTLQRNWLTVTISFQLVNSLRIGDTECEL